MRTNHWQVLLFLGITMILSFFSLSKVWAKDDKRWIAYYGDSIPAENFIKYDLIVFDGEKHPFLRPLLNQNKTLLAYISIGEVRTNSKYFEYAKSNNLLLEENPNWQGSYAIDTRNSAWAELIIEQKIPDILFSGFNGIMIDTLDTSIALEKNDNTKYRGLTESSVNAIKAIRMRYPHIKIMLNRGFEVLDKTTPMIDMLLAESIFAEYNFANKTSKPFDEAIYKSVSDYLKQYQAKNEHLKVYTLDYWDITDKKGMKEIYKTQRANGFIPYVSKITLDDIYAE